MKSILVIDSDPVTASLTRKFLRNYGYEIDLARDGKEALDKVNEPMYDLILSDVQLQGMSGFDVVKLMRRCYISIPVVFLSSIDDQVTELEARSLGCLGFISKRREYINLPHILDKLFYPVHERVA